MKLTKLVYAALILMSLSALALAAQKKEPPHFMFAYHSDSVKLTYNGNNIYILTVPLNNIKSVLALADRPVRLSFELNPQKYAQWVHSNKDPNSFDANPPNIIVSINSTKSALRSYEVKTYKKTDKSIIYKLGMLPVQKPTEQKGWAYQGQATIFIDTSSADQIGDTIGCGLFKIENTCCSLYQDFGIGCCPTTDSTCT